MLYEISNPSDPLTLRSDTFQAAALAVLVLGRGAYGLISQYGLQNMPIFILGGAQEWLDEQGWGEDPFRDNYEAIADALDSVMIGSFAARIEAESAVAKMDPESAKAWLAERHDRRRTSMKDIAGRAWALAKSTREAAERDKAKEQIDVSKDPEARNEA